MAKPTLAALVIAGLALAAACGVQSSGLDANATVTISGKAVAADGQPLANTKVALIKELDLGEAVGGLFVTAVTLGLACLSDHPPALCANNAHVATTDAKGAYSFTVKGSQTQGSLNLASTMEVMTRGTPRPPDVTSPVALEEFNVQVTSLALPDLRVWQPAASIAMDSHSVRSSWQALSSAYGSNPMYNITFNDAHGNPWWVASGVKSGETVDARVLEDMIGTATVRAQSRGSAQGTTVDFTYVSGSVAVRGTSGRPVSRGASCAPVTSSGAGSFVRDCGLTSGDASRAAQLPGTSTAAVIDLIAQRTVSMVVIRGCVSQCRVAGSNDLSAWTDLATVGGPYALAGATSKGPWRFIRVGQTPNITGLRQISVW